MSINTKRKNVNVADLTKQRIKQQLSAGTTTATTPTTVPQSKQPANNVVASHLVSQPGSKMNTTRKIHYAFTILYAVAAFTIVAASIIWINFWTTFQSGALALNVGIAFALFATTIVGKLDRKTLIGEFIVYRKCAIIIGITAIVAMILALFPLYNVVNILTKCPAYTTVSIEPNTNTKAVIKTIVNDTQAPGDAHPFKAADSAYANPNNVKASTNPLYLELMAQEICLYEYAFAILWAIFIIFLILLNIATVPAYAWIKNATT